MLIKIEKFYNLLKSPLSKSSHLNFYWEDKKIKSIYINKNKIPYANNLPILIDFSKSVVHKKIYKNLNDNISLIGKKNIY